MESLLQESIMKTEIYAPYPLIVPHIYLAPVRKVCAGERAVGTVAWIFSFFLLSFFFF